MTEKPSGAGVFSLCCLDKKGTDVIESDGIKATGDADFCPAVGRVAGNAAAPPDQVIFLFLKEENS